MIRLLLGRMRKEAAVAEFSILFWHLSGGAEENKRTSVGIVDAPAEI
jgi:hypothetical protein